MNDRFRHRTRVSRTTAVGKTGSARSRIGASAQRSQALLITLYRSTDCLCRSGAAMKNLAQSASLHAGENNAPSKPGTKQLGPMLRGSAMLQSHKYSVIETLRDGHRLEIRALTSDDRSDLIAAVARTSAESLRRRFFVPKRSFTDQETAFFLNVDFVNHVALVAVLEEGDR